jgi:hypothetical protein
MLTIPTTSNKNFVIEVEMVSNWVSGSVGAGDGSGYKKAGTYKNVSGTLTLNGTLDAIYSHTSSASAPVLTIGTSGSNILVQVSVGSGEVYAVRIVAKVVKV